MTQSVGQKREGGRYAIILADGSIREASEKGNPDAIEREYELKDGSKKTKWEIPYRALVGKISNIYFQDSDYGQQIKVSIVGDAGDQITITLGADSNFGTDFMKKLPNIKLNKNIGFNPYSLIDDRGKNKRGISIKQDGEKIKSFFYDGTKNTNGLPEPEGDTSSYSKDDWKIYFMQVKKFLVDYTEKNTCNKFEKKEVTPDIRDTDSYPEEDISPDDIPF